MLKLLSLTGLWLFSRNFIIRRPRSFSLRRSILRTGSEASPITGASCSILVSVFPPAWCSVSTMRSADFWTGAAYGRYAAPSRREYRNEDRAGCAGYRRGFASSPQDGPPQRERPGTPYDKIAREQPQAGQAEQFQHAARRCGDRAYRARRAAS